MWRLVEANVNRSTHCISLRHKCYIHPMGWLCLLTDHGALWVTHVSNSEMVGILMPLMLLKVLMRLLTKTFPNLLTYLMCPCGLEPMKSVWEEEAKSGRGLDESHLC